MENIHNREESFQRNTESNLNDSEQENLSYDEENDSFELDIKPIDEEEYDHPDPYDTSVKSGADMNSDYDEANPYVGNVEYDKNASLETDISKLAMHEISEDDLIVNERDKNLSRTPEDFREDLDDEGYPLNDRV